MQFRKNQSSFTLVELLITLSILTIIAGSIHLTFSTAISSTRKGEIDMQVYQDGRLVISRIDRELSSCLIPESAEAEDIKFAGAKDDLKFVTISSFHDKIMSHGAKLVEVYYYLESDKDSSILQREERALVGPEADEKYTCTIAEKVTDMSFCYFDGEKWIDSWQEKEELPQAVKITLGLKPSEKTVSFRTTISIPAGKVLTITNEE